MIIKIKINKWIDKKIGEAWIIQFWFDMILVCEKKLEKIMFTLHNSLYLFARPSTQY